MKNKIKIVFCILLIIAITTLVSVFIYRKEIKSKDYDKITDKIANIDNSNTDNSDFMELWESNIIGTLEIPSLKIKLSIADEIDDKTLEEYVGHFPSTSLFDGNVGLAGHNSSNFFASLKNIRKGDEIIYNFLLGKRTYIVDKIVEIQEDDWSYLEDTEDNRLTIITCVKGVPSKRLCIQAKEQN